MSNTSHVPRAGGDPEASRTDRWLALIWIPAFAGNAGERGETTPSKLSIFLILSLSKHEEGVP